MVWLLCYYGMLWVQLFFVCEMGENTVTNPLNQFDFYFFKFSILILNFFEFFPFIFRNLTKKKDNGLFDTLYQSDWYTLPVKYQKDKMHLINGCQNAPQLVFGLFASINRKLFKEVIYYGSKEYQINLKKHTKKMEYLKNTFLRF